MKRLDYAFPNDLYISQEAKDFIKSLLQLNPTDRPTLEEIMDLQFLNGNYPDLCPASSMYITPAISEMRVSRLNNRNV